MRQLSRVISGRQLASKKTWNFKERGKWMRREDGVVKRDASSTSTVRFISFLLSEDVAWALRAHSSCGNVSSSLPWRLLWSFTRTCLGSQPCASKGGLKTKIDSLPALDKSSYVRVAVLAPREACALADCNKDRKPVRQCEPRDSQ